ncbi:MAG: hypothetical protein JNJ73_11545 [Hyphomonadaceae bacterium]|nr:hypothetical protein [Hyphomonadaceae bacterium]
MRLLALLLLGLSLLSGTSLAQPPREALQRYASGDFLGAANAAASAADADAKAFAAQALLAACIRAEPGELDALLTRAERAANMALDIDPHSAEARLQLALVYGIRGKRASLREAFRHDYADRGRTLIAEAIQLAPDDPRALAMLGAWHFEVLRRGGRVGGLIYGARMRDGVAAFEQALRLAPGDPMIALHYALALLQRDTRNGGRAAGLLEAALRASPRDALDRHAQAEARRLADVLARSGPHAAAEAARESRF